MKQQSCATNSRQQSCSSINKVSNKKHIFLYCERQQPWILLIFAEIPSRSSTPVGLPVFRYVGRSTCFEAIGKRLPLVWEFVRTGLCLVQRAVLTPMVTPIHASKAQGTRETFLKKVLIEVGTSQLPICTSNFQSLWQ